MRRLRCGIAILAFALILVGCKKDDTGSSASQFSDKLTLGTGMSGFTITGEGTTFTKNASSGQADIYWRLECKDDYGTQGARLRIERSVSGTFQPHTTINPPVPQEYGHIYLHGPVGITAGTYRATGVHIASGREVAVVNFVVQ